MTGLGFSFTRFCLPGPLPRMFASETGFISMFLFMLQPFSLFNAYVENQTVQTRYFVYRLL